MLIPENELPEFRVLDGVKYYCLSNKKFAISKEGKIIGPSGKLLHTVYRNNNNQVNINGGTTPVYKIILEIFYGKTDNDIGDYVLCFKDNDRSVTNLDTVEPMSIEDYCNEVRPGIDYALYTKDAIKYILFKSGELFNIKLKKFLVVKKHKVPKYISANRTIHVSDILIEKFGDTMMNNHRKQYSLVGGIGYDNLVYNEISDLNSKEEDISDAEYPDVEVTKYRCKSCELNFKADSMKQIIKLNKLCIPCTRYLKQNDGKSVVLTDIDTSRTFNGNDNYVCLRCKSGYKSEVSMCLQCDCLDIVKK